MRKYTLASPDARVAVDLREHSDVIVAAVMDVMDDEDVEVVVRKDCYYVSPTPDRGDAIRIGRLICKSALGKHCVQIPKLFSSIEVEEEPNDETEQQKPNGGHH